MKFNYNSQILFKVAPPIPWSGFFGIHSAWDMFNQSQQMDKVEANGVKPDFTYSGKNYNALIKFINKL